MIYNGLCDKLDSYNYWNNFRKWLSSFVDPFRNSDKAQYGDLIIEKLFKIEVSEERLEMISKLIK